MALRLFTYINASEGYSQEQGPSDELSLGKITLLGVSGIAIAAGGQLISGVADPVSAQDAATKAYVDALAAGLNVQNAVRAATIAPLDAYGVTGATVAGRILTSTANAALVVDGVTLAVGQRVLVKNETAGNAIYNGIWQVSATGADDPGGAQWVLIRPSDYDGSPASEISDGDFVFVGEGSLASTGWVQTTNLPTLETTALVWSQFNAQITYSGGAGLLLTGTVFDVELHTAADAQSGGSGGGSSGLEFDAAGAGGKLRAAVHATAGLERTASGLGAKLNGTTLQSAAGGLSVKGLPSLFEINAITTSANVTAANLGTLTAGPDSDATALHFHSNNVQIWTTSGTVDLGDAVYISGNNVISSGAPSSDATAKIIGVSRETVLTGLPCEIVSSGVVAGALSGATANTTYFLGTGGAPVLIGALAGGDRIVRLGYAKNATDLEVRIQDMGKKA